MSKRPKAIAILGPTASGKTSLAISIAQKFPGEVISADSRQVYRGLDIGSGKVTKEEMAGVPHHLLDVADPKDSYTAADFKKDAKQALLDITSRHKLPIVAGGTFFYTDLLRGRSGLATVPPNPTLREKLSKLPTSTLYEKLKGTDPLRAETIDRHNPHRLIRALEITEAQGRVPEEEKEVSPYTWLVLGLNLPKEQLHQNIHERIHARLKVGMIEEVAGLLASGIEAKRLYEFGLEYRYISLFITGQLTQEEMLQQLETKTKQFAKRQLTWLKRDEEVVWVNPSDEADILARVGGFLSE